MTEFAVDDFQPLPVQVAGDADTILEGPSLWQRLFGDLRAIVAVTVVAILLFAALAGPLLWRQDPAQQWLSQVSSGPSFARTVEVVAEVENPADKDLNLNLEELIVVESTTTQVELQWPQVAHAVLYRVYRSEAEGSQGIPLVEGGEHFYVDRLQLRERRYYYTVVAVDAEGRSLQSMHVDTEPRLTIGHFEAKLLALDIIDDQVRLPAHPLGTDALGRDMLSRIIHGARTSMLVALTAPLIFIGLGAFYGAAAGLLGGWVDNVMMRIADFVVALPFLLFMILFRVALGIQSGESGLFPMILAMVLLSWPSSARLVRGQVLQLRESAFVLSARLAGAGNLYLIRRHLLPNVLPLLLVSLSFAIPQAIFTEALLSFIGMGVVPPTPSWGTLCNEGIRSMLTQPRELIIPAVTISIAVLAFNVLGDALRDALDVKMRRSLR